jgi:hypothetical protein
MGRTNPHVTVAHGALAISGSVMHLGANATTIKLADD